MIKTITQVNKEKILFWLLICSLFLLVGFYMYCIKSTVKNVVLREKLENEATKISLEISNKEFKYISMKNAVTMDLAFSLGFKEFSNKIFIDKNSSGEVSYAGNVR